MNAIQGSPVLANADNVDLRKLGLPADAMIDPFTEMPLFIRKTESGWLIYSVGFDLKDNGGDVDQRDVGIAPLK